MAKPYSVCSFCLQKAKTELLGFKHLKVQATLNGTLFKKRGPALTSEQHNFKIACDTIKLSSQVPQGFGVTQVDFLVVIVITCNSLPCK
jgi:hypothetical protein